MSNVTLASLVTGHGNELATIEAFTLALFMTLAYVLLSFILWKRGMTDTRPLVSLFFHVKHSQTMIASRNQFLFTKSFDERGSTYVSFYKGNLLGRIPHMDQLTLAQSSGIKNDCIEIPFHISGWPKLTRHG